MNPRALTLDIGSTRIKLAALMANGSLSMLGERAFPKYSGRGLVKECDPISLRDRIDAMLDKVRGIGKGCPIGLSVQRSSFLIWDRITGQPLTKVLSWLDRRSEAWCQENNHLQPKIWEKTGLPLSPHYAGPKLAYLLRSYPWLEKMAAKGLCCFGTLDSYLIWNWTRSEKWQIETGMAARTLMFDLGSRSWDGEILRDFKIPAEILPEISECPGNGYETPNGFRIKAVLPDQLAAVLPLFKQFPKAAVVNAGTGTFVLRKAIGRAPHPYITAGIGGSPSQEMEALWEGTINAGASLWNQWKERLLTAANLPQDHFAAPEDTGWGAPYWRGNLGQICSGPNLSDADRAYLLLEGYAFRVRQILETLLEGTVPEPLLVGGGLTLDEKWLEFLANRLPWQVYTLKHRQWSLWGAGWQADNQEVTFLHKPEPADFVFSDRHTSRYQSWLQWMQLEARNACI